MHTALYTHPIATDIASALVVIIEVCNCIYCTCYLLAHRCTKHPVLINAHSAGSYISPLSLVVRIVVINFMHCMESMHTLHVLFGVLHL